MAIPLPRMDARLQGRYETLVQQHMDVATTLAAGIHALPNVGSAFAAAQAAWRFFKNEAVTLPLLVEPLRDLGRLGAAQSSSAYALLVHDWSKLDYDGHTGKKDLVQLSNPLDRGYELTTALLVDAAQGMPVAPMELSVRAAQGRFTTAHAAVQPYIGHLEQILPVMQASGSWSVGRRLVHVIDREGDSLFHLRAWHADGHLFLVRADDRRVHFRDSSSLLSEIVATLQAENAFRKVREVEIRGQAGTLFVAEVEVVLDGAAWQYDENDKKYRVPGAALPLRFVVAQVRDAEGKVIAEWLLLTNVPGDVGAELIATWYYWRWKIETFHKVMKSAGLQMEEWQQESAGAISKRILVACMACVVVWQLERQRTPAAQACKALLMKLSGRQTKRSRPVTTPALLAGLQTLLVMLSVLEQYTPQELWDLVKAAELPICQSG